MPVVAPKLGRPKGKTIPTLLFFISKIFMINPHVVFHFRFLDVVKGTAKVKISNRKDSAREDALDDGPDESGEAKSPSSSQQDVPSVAKEAPIKSPEPATASVVPSTTTSQVPSGAAPSAPSSASAAATSKPAKSHSSQSASMPSS